MTGFFIRFFIFALATVFLESPLPAADKLVGTKAPEWNVTSWQHSKPLNLGDLKGKVVLVRWWTAPECRYCRATAPALNEFHQQYAKQGLQVIGLYHHKSDGPLNPENAQKYSDQFGFKFPVAIDEDWKTLRNWWLEKDQQKWTSVSVLIDRKGVIRHIHPGGEYVKGDRDYDLMKKKIEELLAEK